MSVLDRNPTTTDLLQGSKYLLTFSRIKDVQFFCQRVNLPGVSIEELSSPTTFSTLKIPGSKIRFDDLDVEFILDNQLTSWREINSWIQGLSNPHDFSEYSNLNRLSKVSVNATQPQYSDATLTILSGLNNVKLRIKFNQVFPTSVSSIRFDTKLTAEDIMTASASFSFTNYDIELL